jgi:hypothetical protein
LTGIGVYVPTTDLFFLRNTANAGSADAGTFQFSAPGSIGVTGDWNGDGQDDFGVFDSNSATWSLKYGAEAGVADAGTFTFGAMRSLPVVGDWDGDGRDDIGTFSPATATWVLRYGASPGLVDAGMFSFGAPNSLPIVGDWDGDGVDGIGTYTVSNSNWMLRQTPNAGPVDIEQFRFGPSEGTPVSGDWDGDGVDGIGVFQSRSALWALRQTTTSGNADAGLFFFGGRNNLPLVGNFQGQAPAGDALTTLVLPPLNLDLLGLEVRTSPITITLSAEAGDGNLLGNLLNTVSTLVDLDSASDAINNVLDATVDLVNSVDLTLPNLGSGPLDNAPQRNFEVLELFVAPVHLDLLGVHVDTSTIRVTITGKTGQGKVLGNAVNELVNLFNPPLPDQLDVNFLNTKLEELLGKLETQLPGIPSAETPPPVEPSEGRILSVTVPALDLDLLGLSLETSPITVNADAATGDGLLLGNVLTTALNTLGATPENMADLSDNINDVLAKVVGVLNVGELVLPSTIMGTLPPVIQTLASVSLTAPAEGSTVPVLDLLIASPDGVSPPVAVDLLGLNVTTSNIEAHLTATTGEGNLLGNLVYNLANLADPGGPASLLNLFNLLGSDSLNSTDPVTGGSVTPATTTPEELLTLTLDPLNIDLLGLEIQSEPIVVTLSAQEGDGKLLGNLLSGITTLINVDGVSAAINNVLSTTVDLVNSASLAVEGVGSGVFDTGTAGVLPVLDLYVAPVHLDLLGLVATTSPIHLTVNARSGDGLVLGNVLTALANTFNPPLPEELDIDFLNERLEQLIDDLALQIPGITPETPPVTLDEGQFLELTVPALDVDLLGLSLNTSPITINASAETGNGLLLGNILTTVLNTVDATTQNLTGLNNNLNTLLAQVVGVLNAAELVLGLDPLAGLPSILQTLASPTLVTAEPGATVDVLNLSITSDTGNQAPVDVSLLGLLVTTSDIEASLTAETGDGNLLGNLVYNVANLLNPNGTTTLLLVLSQLARL